MPRELDRNGFALLAITVSHALAVQGLPRLHADPFDRLLIAQAMAETMTLCSADAMFADYGVALVALVAAHRLTRTRPPASGIDKDHAR